MKRRIGRLKIFSPFHSEIRSSLLALLAACTFLATCTFCTQDAMAGAENGSAFKGALNLQAMLSTRFFKPSGTFDISSYFNQHLALQYGYIPPIIQLLGFYDSAGMSSAFVNGTPNPVNMLIHDVIFSSFTHELAQICVDLRISVIPPTHFGVNPPRHFGVLRPPHRSGATQSREDSSHESVFAVNSFDFWPSSFTD